MDFESFVVNGLTYTLTEKPRLEKYLDTVAYFAAVVKSTPGEFHGEYVARWDIDLTTLKYNIQKPASLRPVEPPAVTGTTDKK